MKKQLLMFISILLSLSVSNYCSAQKVKVITYHTHPPFILAAEGLSYDLVELLNSHAPDKYSFELQPMSRPALNKKISSSSVFVVPWVNPAWFQDQQKSKYTWLQRPLMEDGNEVISLANRPINYTQAKDLDGLTLGGLKGHRYAGIDVRIDELGNTRRVDSNNHLDNFRKLQKGLIDVTITPRSAALFLINKQNLVDQLHVSTTPHSRYWRQMFITGNDQQLADALNNLMLQPEWQAEWQNALAKYR